MALGGSESFHGSAFTEARSQGSTVVHPGKKVHRASLQHWLLLQERTLLTVQQQLHGVCKVLSA